MYTEDAIAYFKSKPALAHAAGVRSSTVYKWGKLVPEGRAHRLVEASGGVLKFDAALYKSRSHSAGTD